MTIEEMKSRKKELGYSNETIAQLSGVPFSTVQKIFSGITNSPRQKTIEALEKVLRPVSASGAYVVEKKTSSQSLLRETAVPYRAGRQGEYTLEDYYALPEDHRAELIDGEIFDMSAPTALHQMILGELYLHFRKCADDHCPSCRVFLSPCDVRLDDDNRTMVQPDLFVLCSDFDFVKNRSFNGAPDLTVEILSEATKSKDLLIKTYKYKKAGVKEYWIIDPERLEILAYDFEGNHLDKYTFNDQVPIRISKGRCKIDFTHIRRSLGL